jgi:glycosyltransferase involved in cell wall biosynthesis
MIFEVRDLWPEIPIAIGALRNPVTRCAARMLERLSYKNSQHIVALSTGMRDGVISSGFPSDKITVIPNSSDLELFSSGDHDALNFRKNHPELGSDPLVVYTGTIGRINGVDYLPRIAAASLRGEAYTKFVVVGGGACEHIVREEAARLGVLNNNFFIYPPVLKKEMPNVLAAADISMSLFIDLKEMWANSANKFFDSLASGTPLVINYEGWQADLLRESGAGIVIPPGDAEAAADMIDRFLRNREILEKSAKAALSLAKDRFSRDELARQLSEVLITNARKAA